MKRVWNEKNLGTTFSSALPLVSYPHPALAENRMRVEVSFSVSIATPAVTAAYTAQGTHSTV